MNLPPEDIQVYLIVGFDGPEGLADPSQGKEGRGVHIRVIGVRESFRKNPVKPEKRKIY